ncbi:Rad1/Rec1/Rad17 [Dipodascopsis tothii]|uniref:Rad1/Rec1/Rad17 n=1 Tax=Dipodascopsis tothii TaxID=44089 RepID=UPI0034CDE1A9
MDDYAFDAVTTCVSYIYRLLKAISSVSPRATVTISSRGLMISVDSARACNAHTFLARSLFSSYEFRGEPGAEDGGSGDEDADTVFMISLSSLVECVQIFGTVADLPSGRGGDDEYSARSFISGSSVCKMRYDPREALFVLMIDEGAMTTTCELLTFEPEGAMSDITLSHSSNVRKVIMKAEYVDGAFRELESPASETMVVRFAPTEPHLVFECRGDIGSVEYTFPKDWNVLETFAVTEACEFSYPFSIVNKTRDAVRMASKVCLRTDSNGVMSIQSMCEVGDGRQTFIDYRFLPIRRLV